MKIHEIKHKLYEMKWMNGWMNQVQLNCMKMKLHEVPRKQMECNEIEWNEIKLTWRAIKWHEIEWVNEMAWHGITWNEIKGIGMTSHDMKLKLHETT